MADHPHTPSTPHDGSPNGLSGPVRQCLDVATPSPDRAVAPACARAVVKAMAAGVDDPGRRCENGNQRGRADEHTWTLEMLSSALIALEGYARIREVMLEGTAIRATNTDAAAVEAVDTDCLLLAGDALLARAHHLVATVPLEAPRRLACLRAVTRASSDLAETFGTDPLRGLTSEEGSATSDARESGAGVPHVGAPSVGEILCRCGGQLGMIVSGDVDEAASVGTYTGNLGAVLDHLEVVADEETAVRVRYGVVRSLRGERAPQLGWQPTTDERERLVDSLEATVDARRTLDRTAVLPVRGVGWLGQPLRWLVRELDVAVDVEHETRRERDDDDGEE